VSLAIRATSERILSRESASSRGQSPAPVTTERRGDPEVIGCLYIYPAKDGEHDAQVRSWVRSDVAELDATLHAAVSRWLAERWPFQRVLYAERLVP
jgi:hypothetical protein